MLAQLCRRLRGERDERFRDAVERRDWLAEGARTRHAVRVCVIVPVIVAWLAAKLGRRAEKHNAPDGADNLIAGVAEVFRREYLLGAELHREPVTDAPHLVGWKRGENLRRIVWQHKHTIGALFADVVGNLGERLCRGEAHAARDADPTENLCAEALAVFDEVDAVAHRRVDERLVDGILFNVQCLIAED